MSDNPLADVFAAYGGDRSGSAVRAFEEYVFDYAMERGCDLGRDAEAYVRLRVVTSAVRGGDYSDAWMRGALDALRDAIYSSRSRAEELRRRVDVALRVTQPIYERAEVFDKGSEIANAFRLARERTSPALATGDDLDRLAAVYDMRRGPAEPDEVMRERIFDSLRTTVRATVRQYVDGEWRELRPMTATQQREADARAEWRRRTIESMGEYAWKLCGSCGRQTRRSVLCFRCRGDAPAALARWCDWITQRQRHAAPVPLDDGGEVAK